MNIMSINITKADFTTMIRLTPTLYTIINIMFL